MVREYVSSSSSDDESFVRREATKQTAVPPTPSVKSVPNSHIYDAGDLGDVESYDPLNAVPPSLITTKNLNQFMFLNKNKTLKGTIGNRKDTGQTFDVAFECYETLDKTYLSSMKHLSLPVNKAGKGILIGRPNQNAELPRSSNGLFSAKILSRQHAHIRVDTLLKKVVIQDLGSSNGTFVHGTRLSEEGIASDWVVLDNGAVVDFGVDLALSEKEDILPRIRVVLRYNDRELEHLFRPSLETTALAESASSDMDTLNVARKDSLGKGAASLDEDSIEDIALLREEDLRKSKSSSLATEASSMKRHERADDTMASTSSHAAAAAASVKDTRRSVRPPSSTSSFGTLIFLSLLMLLLAVAAWFLYPIVLDRQDELLEFLYLM